MKKVILSLLVLLLVLCGLAHGQFVATIPATATSVGGTLTFVQSGSCTANSAYSCSVTMSTGSLTAGNAYLIGCDGGEAYENIICPVFVAGSQTYTLGTSAGSNTLLQAVGCSNGVNAQTWMPQCLYILPPYTNGGTSPITAYFTAPIAGAPTTGTCTAGETMTQATSGSTAILYQAYSTVATLTGTLVVYKVTGSPTATNVWTGGTSGCTYTPTAVPDLAGVTSGAHVFIAEIHPSANGSQVGLANDTALLLPTASTTLTGPSITTSGTSPVIFGEVIGNTTNLTISGVNSPYSGTNQNFHGGNNEGFAVAQTTTIPGWTVSSATGITRGFAIAYNPTAFNEGWFLGFDSCTSGSALTANCITNSTVGWNPAIWAEGGTSGLITANTSANLAPLSQIGPLGDGSTTAAGSGTMGAVITGNGSNTNDRWIMSTTDSYASNLSSWGSIYTWFRFETNVNCATSVNSNSLTTTRGINDDDWADFYVNSGAGCVLKIGNSNGTSSGSITINSAEPYIADIFYSNNAGVNTTLRAFTDTAATGMSCTSGITTVTTAGLPADGNVTTGSTVTIKGASPSSWNGTFTSITVSGNNISYSQTCPGASYSSGAYVVAQVGSTLNAGTPKGINWAEFGFGTSSSSAIPNGTTEYIDSIFLSTVDPLNQ